MNIDFSQALVGLDGKELINDAKEVTRLGGVCAAALCAPGGEPVTPEENVRMWRLAMSVAKMVPSHVTAEEVVLMKKRLAAMYAPLVAGQAAVMLDQDILPTVKAA